MTGAETEAEGHIREAEAHLRAAASMIPCHFCSSHVEEAAQFSADLADLAHYRQESADHARLATAMGRIMESEHLVGVLSLLYRVLRRVRFNR